jgi:hypothetical protein
MAIQNTTSQTERNRSSREPYRLRSDLRAFEIRAVDCMGRLPHSRKLPFGSPAPFPVRPNLAVILATAAVHPPGRLTRGCQVAKVNVFSLLDIFVAPVDFAAVHSTYK